MTSTKIWKRIALSIKKGQEWPLTISDSNFCFTCPVLDATFISLTQQQVAQVEQNGKFLEILLGSVNRYTSEKIETVMVVQYPHGGRQGQSHGQITSDWHCDFLHNASTEVGSSGSPVVDTNGNVVGIHKGRHEAVNIAVKLKYVVDALMKDHTRGLTHIPREPISFQKHKEIEGILHGHGLFRATEADSVVFRLRHEDIWFQRTAHFWYWTSDSNHLEGAWSHWRQIHPDLPLEDLVDDRHKEIIRFLKDSGDEFL